MNGQREPVFGIATTNRQPLDAIDGLELPIVPCDPLGSQVWTQCQTIGVTHLITLEPGLIADSDLRPLVEQLMNVSRQEPAAVVFGVPNGSGPRVRLTFSERMNTRRTDRWFQWLSALPVKHVSGRFRVYPVELLAPIASAEVGDAWMLEMMVRAVWGGLPLADVDLPIPRPRPLANVSALWRRLFLRWLVILPVRPQKLLNE